MIATAVTSFPGMKFISADVEDDQCFASLREETPFDIILLDNILCHLSDIQSFLERLHVLCTSDTRIIIVTHSYLWEPILRLGRLIRFRVREPVVNWLRNGDMQHLLLLTDFEIIKHERRILFPFHCFGLGSMINKYIATLPLLDRLCINHYRVVRPLFQERITENYSASVVIPCKNEFGNIQPAIERLPSIAGATEIVFVEGGSTDGTWQEIQRVISENPNKNIRAIRQTGTGKGDAVRCGFQVATGDVFIILDADLTVPPEDLPKFYKALAQGRGEYINGSRLVYAMDKDAMRFLNKLANHLFAVIFSYLLSQPFTDTLCGTKVLLRRHYELIAKHRSYFGDFDPFGDFDLIFGASKLNLKIVEIPIRYAAREYGNTQILRFRHGLLLARMVFFAYRKLKALPNR